MALSTPIAEWIWSFAFSLQVELYSQENAQLKGVLQYLQLQPEAARKTPLLADVENVTDDVLTPQHDSGASSAPNQAQQAGSW